MLHALTVRRPSRFLTSTALVGATLGLLLGASAAHAAFDPTAGANDVAPVTSQTRSRLPDTSVLRGEAPRPLYSPSGVAAPVAPNSYASPLQPLQMPKPLYPAKAEQPQISAAPIAMPAPVAAPAPMVAPAPMLPQMPEVDPAVAAQAQAEMAAQQASTPVAPIQDPAAAPAPAANDFIAPPPLLAPAPVSSSVAAASPTQPEPLVVPAPSAATNPPLASMAAPASTLNENTRAILSTIPARIDTPVAQKPSKLALQRVNPQINDVLGARAKDETYESVGLSIKVSRPGLDTNYELNSAYTSLMGGDTQRAIEIYKNILASEPRNEDALFGLASTYHRTGQAEKARPFYGQLLKQNPNHREGLNNFLVLVSDESPQDALPELERLEQRNPDFAPIPAQIAIVLDKLGYTEQAEERMLRAIDIAPENSTYKYNLAVMLDRHGKYADASALYSMLIESSLRGDSVPASVDSMQRRLNYLTTAMSTARAG